MKRPDRPDEWETEDNYGNPVIVWDSYVQEGVKRVRRFHAAYPDEYIGHTDGYGNVMMGWGRTEDEAIKELEDFFQKD